MHTKLSSSTTPHNFSNHCQSMMTKCSQHCQLMNCCQLSSLQMHFSPMTMNLSCLVDAMALAGTAFPPSTPRFIFFSGTCQSDAAGWRRCWFLNNNVQNRPRSGGAGPEKLSPGSKTCLATRDFREHAENSCGREESVQLSERSIFLASVSSRAHCKPLAEKGGKFSLFRGGFSLTFTL